MSDQLGALNLRPVHPASPVLLTKNGPLGAAVRATDYTKILLPRADSKFDNRPRGIRPPSPLIIRFTRRHPVCACYPEGNFGGNQLLGGSISLSPLYPTLTIDLHVRTAASLHQSFLCLRPSQA